MNTDPSDDLRGRPWSCYPLGVETSRRTFLRALATAAAAHHGVAAKNVLVGCGSTEFLQFAPWPFFTHGGNLVLPSPTYGWSAGVVEAMGGEARRVPLRKDGTVDLEGLKKTVDRDTRMVYLANPNNPTGASLPFEEVASLAASLAHGTARGTCRPGCASRWACRRRTKPS